MPRELVGPRVVLRAVDRDDVDAMYAAIVESREHLRPWMEWADDHRTVDDARAHRCRSMANWLLRTSLGYSIFDRRNDRYLGAAGFSDIDWAVRSFAVGSWLRVSAIGHGYATEATRLLVDCAFAALAARRVQLTCDAANEASRRVAARAGFVLEARLRNARLTPAGDVADTLVFALVPEEWQRVNADATADT